MREINNHIDKEILPFYGDEEYLSVDSLPSTEVKKLLDILMQNDTSVRDYVLSEMQDLIDKRLEERQSDNRFKLGFKTIRLSNGDSRIVNSRGV